MMKKKAQGMSINVIIVAALALVVLVVLFAIFTGKLGIFTKGEGTAREGATSCICATNGGSCSEIEGATSTPPDPAAKCPIWTDCGNDKCYKRK